MSTSNVNLDLTDVDSDDLDQLATKIEQFYRQDSAVKAQLAWNWERNHLFLDGKQWIVYDGQRETGGMWKKLQVSRENEYIPRPTTNYIFDSYQTLKSYLIKNKPRSTVRPNTQLFDDKQGAKIATLCLDANWERLKEDQNYEYAAACGVTYGTVFKKSYWDNSALSMAKVPKMQMVPKTDPTTGAVVGQEERQVVDPQTGDPVYDVMPLGDVSTAVVEPYRICMDPLATDLHNSRWVLEFSIQAIGWVKESYDKDPEQFPGYTGRIGELEPEKSLSGSMRRFYDLKASSGVKYGGIAEGGNPTDQIPDNTVVVKEYYERPTMKYPKGRLIVVANDIPLYSGDSPYEGPEMGDWHPYSEFRWEIVPGRFWGKSPFDDAVEVQKQINSIDSIVILNRKTQAIPQKLIPKHSGVTPGQWTGRPGQEIYYNDPGTGSEPKILPAAGVHEQVFQERAQRVEDLKTITGGIDILKGDRPPGVTAASALNMLYEVGTGKLFPALGRWKLFVESDQKKQLKLIAKKYKEPRPDYIRLLRAKNSELAEQDINKFLGSDMHDNCNVVVEAGSNIPKLQAAKQALLMELAQTGVLNLELPANRMEFQHDMGISGYDNDVGPDTKRAEWENTLLDNIQNSPDNKPIVLACDDHQIHLDVLHRRMKEPSFISLPAEVQQAYMAHEQEHEQMQQQQQQAQILQQQAMGPQAAPAGPPQQGNAPKPLHGAGKGTTAQLKNALGQDAMTPGQLGGGRM